MKRILLVLFSIIVIGIGATVDGKAQVKGFAIGPKAGLYLDKGRFMVGAVGEFPFAPNLFFEPGLELVTGILNTTRIVGDANVRLSFLLQGLTVEPFVLGGLGGKLEVYRTTGDTRTGFRFNLGGGTTFNTRGLIQPWVGIKIYFLDNEDSDLLLQGGINFFL
jgi:hypothetical protein